MQFQSRRGSQRRLMKISRRFFFGAIQKNAAGLDHRSITGLPTLKTPPSRNPRVGHPPRDWLSAMKMLYGAFVCDWCLRSEHAGENSVHVTKLALQIKSVGQRGSIQIFCDTAIFGDALAKT